MHVGSSRRFFCGRITPSVLETSTIYWYVYSPRVHALWRKTVMLQIRYIADTLAMWVYKLSLLPDSTQCEAFRLNMIGRGSFPPFLIFAKLSIAFLGVPSQKVCIYCWTANLFRCWWHGNSCTSFSWPIHGPFKKSNLSQLWGHVLFLFFFCPSHFFPRRSLLLCPPVAQHSTVAPYSAYVRRTLLSPFIVDRSFKSCSKLDCMHCTKGQGQFSPFWFSVTCVKSRPCRPSQDSSIHIHKASLFPLGIYVIQVHGFTCMET